MARCNPLHCHLQLLGWWSSLVTVILQFYHQAIPLKFSSRLWHGQNLGRHAKNKTSFQVVSTGQIFWTVEADFYWWHSTRSIFQQNLSRNFERSWSALVMWGCGMNPKTASRYILASCIYNGNKIWWVSLGHHCYKVPSNQPSFVEILEGACINHSSEAGGGKHWVFNW